MQAYTHKLGIDLKIDNYKDLECYKVELSKKEYVHLLDKIDQLERTIDIREFTPVECHTNDGSFGKIGYDETGTFSIWVYLSIF